MATKAAGAAGKLDASMRVVILHGPDRYLRIEYTKLLIRALEESFGEVGVFTFDGEVAQPAEVLDELRSFGLLQTHKLVILDDADSFLAIKDENEDAPSVPKGRRQKTARELMESYAQAPVESATLLLRADTWRLGKLDKAVAKVGTAIKCESPNDAKAATFCIARCEKEHGATITRDAAAILVDRIGSELARLDVELAKLAAYVGEGGTIQPDDVRTMVGLSREERAWQIQSALLTGSPREAVTMLNDLLEISRQPMELIAWSITDLLRKLHAASRLIRQGMSPGAISKQIKLWGEAQQLVLGAARRIEPDRFAQLLQDAIDADYRGKRGIGSPPRTFEALAARIADTMKRS